MLLSTDIIKDGNPTLRLIAEKVKTPITKGDLATAKRMLKYLKMSQNDKLAQKYNMRAGVGLAAPQINISKRFFACLIPTEDDLIEFAVFNPEIVAESVELFYLGSGEGCLSVPNKTGFVLRHKKIKVKGIFYNPVEKTLEEKVVTFKGYPAIVFQHEFDHLNGILFTDKITNDVMKYERIF